MTGPRQTLLLTTVALAVVAPTAGALPDAEGRLVVSFSDAPGAEVAKARLAGLGTLTPTLPEEGIWTLRTRRSPGARPAVLDRPRVRVAEWSLLHHSAELEPVPALPLPKKFATPRDTFFRNGRQWGLHGSAFWRPRIAARTPRPRIAVLDSGVDAGHEEWRARGSRLSPLVAGRSTIGRPDRWQDRHVDGHGTHVAGIAAAPANGVGIVGVAPAAAGDAEVIPVQIADPEGVSTDETMIKGIRWAVRRGAKVISISAGGPGRSSAVQEAIYWATERGAVIVASVGNDGHGGSALSYPAAYRRVIGVGALCDGKPTTRDCEAAPTGVAAFSSRNRSVDLVAPGVNVISSVPGYVRERRVAPGYALKDGTSMAAPFVAGAAALVFANHPDLSAHQVRRQLANTATDIGRRGLDNTSGEGVVNPEAAARFAAPPDDPYEVNDTIRRAARIGLPLGRTRTIEAMVDRREDPTDLYAVRLRRGERVIARLTHAGGRIELRLWGPGVRRITRARRARALLSLGRGNERAGRADIALGRRVPRTGRYLIDVGSRGGIGAYRLSITRYSAAASDRPGEGL